jgi:3-hydroxyisobutyrate dehydrogenase-like beta-hydroxyacid dehydrogenase
MTTIGLIGAGHMGAALGRSLRQGGHDVATTLDGRSARTARLAGDAGLRILPTTEALVSAAEIVLVVTPPEAALSAATRIADAGRSTGATPLVADLNAVSPSTVEEIDATLAAAGIDLVDGAISGPPPGVAPGARVYLAGPRSDEIHQLSWHGVRTIVVSGQVGDASAVKMCTASVYKGTVGIITQALRTARHYGVTDHVLDDLGPDGKPAVQVAFAAAKAWRYVGEMREIAAAQAAAGQPRELFEAMALVYEALARTELARVDPESVDTAMPAADVLERLVER